MSEPSIDEADELDAATDEERREADALARALEGSAGDEAPADAASTAAFLRTVASDASTDRRVATVESRLFGRAEPTTNVRRLRGRPLAYATVVLASAAAVLVVARRAEPSMAPAATSAETATRAPQAAAPPSATTTASPTTPTTPTTLSLLDAERGLLEAPGATRDGAFEAFRSAMATARDQRLGAMITQHGGTP